ncbi:MAG: hypothetical protein Q4P36_01945 [Bowdeniella nasicola]|nr:hypothetical protein [Bowdeniella nasicola]
MSLFEFDSGHLVPAQFGRATAARLDDEALEAVRHQVLELVGRPLFPVVWSENSQLLSMDASGQVVTVDIIRDLDAAALVAALSRAGHLSALGWLELAARYPAGEGAFRRDWNRFRESLPPRTPSGPRVVIVADHISDDVRPALEMLSGAGVEVFELTLRQFSDGRRFLDVAPVRGPIAERSQMVLLGRSAQIHELDPAPTDLHPTAEPDQDTQEAERAAALSAEDDPEGGASSVFDVPEPPSLDVTEPPTALDVEDTQEASVQTVSAEPMEAPPVDAEPVAASEVRDREPLVSAPEAPSYTTPMDEDARMLLAIAEYVGEDTVLVWRQLRRGLRHTITLRVSGELVTEDGQVFRDPNAAACAVSHREDVDGWRVWRFGEAGANLDDARHELAELNGQPPRGRRAR